MRIAVLGDIHANLEALRAVVDAASRENVDEWVQVGDIVGYGPEPSECIDMVRQLGATVCLGNHDAAVLGMLDTAYFNSYARSAIEWTRTRLRPADFDFLRALQLVVQKREYTVVHGTLHMPDLFGYVVSQVEAFESLSLQTTPLCFVGHSHVPAIYVQRAPREVDWINQQEIDFTLPQGLKALVNVGSVGQPRDEDPRAAYAICDTDRRTIAIRRVSYDIAAVQRKIRAAGLPEMLAHRLSLGV